MLAKQRYSHYNEAKESKDAVTAESEPLGQHLNLKVKSQDGDLIYFRMKDLTPFKKLIEIYCKKYNLNTSNVRFLFDGERLQESQTPKDLKMATGDQIDIFVEQCGGGI